MELVEEYLALIILASNINYHPTNHYVTYFHYFIENRSALVARSLGCFSTFEKLQIDGSHLL